MYKLLCVILFWPSKIENSLILMQNVFEVWEFKEKLIENLIFGRSGFNISVFKKHFISYSCILFIKYYALRRICIKLLCFSKICFFQIFDRSNLLLDQSKLWLKFWFESAWFDWCSIAAGSNECNFRSIEPIAQLIEIAIKILVRIYLARSMLNWCWIDRM